MCEIWRAGTTKSDWAPKTCADSLNFCIGPKHPVVQTTVIRKGFICVFIVVKECFLPKCRGEETPSPCLQFHTLSLAETCDPWRLCVVRGYLLLLGYQNVQKMLLAVIICGSFDLECLSSSSNQCENGDRTLRTQDTSVPKTMHETPWTHLVP